MNRANCFKIDISIQKDAPLVESDKRSIFQLNCGHWYSIGDPVTIDADPFLFVHNDRLYLFYEDLHFYRFTGAIKMVSTSDLKHWTAPVEITHEPECHFSYPYVFEDKGEIYMMPETGWQNNIRLYKADRNDLSKFTLYKVILQREKLDPNIEFDWCDSCFYRKDGLYYLITTVKTKQQYEMQLYTSTQLEGSYTEHPMSPVVKGDDCARCAGSLMEKDGHIYRFAQDCSEAYGGQVSLFEIDEITPTAYREHLVKKHILPTDQKFYRMGGHQVNFATFRGQTVVATDARDEATFYAERTVRKFFRTLHLLKF